MTIFPLSRDTGCDTNSPPTPMISGMNFSSYTGDPFENGTMYRNIVGALQYVTITIPEISFSINKVSQYMQNTLNPQWNTDKRILRYLKGTIDHGPHLSRQRSLDLTGFSDAKWVIDRDDRRSVTWLRMYLSSNLVACSAQRSRVLSLILQQRLSIGVWLVPL